MIKTFFLQPLLKVRQHLRRSCDEGGECSDINNYGYHNAIVRLGDVDIPEMPMSTKYPGEREFHMLEIGTSILEDGKIGPIDESDPRWPTHCTCGFKFPDTVKKQYWPQRLYRRIDTGEEMTLREAPVGAMWHTDYTGHTGPDGHCLVVRIPPKHDWMVEGRASNCDSPCAHCRVPYHSHQTATCTNPGDGQHAWTKGAYVDSRPEHRCWVRHGDPSKGEIVHVDKNGPTCNAGAGSIIGPEPMRWHGFLHNGHLTQC